MNSRTEADINKFMIFSKQKIESSNFLSLVIENIIFPHPGKNFFLPVQFHYPVPVLLSSPKLPFVLVPIVVD